jgi:2-C-methyl-D-erythritol 4-phosphate cytidylyltransferase
MDPLEAVAIVPAGGKGERLGLGAKAFLELGGRTLLEIVTQKLQPRVSRIVVGVPAEDVHRARGLLPASVEIISGGNTRQATVERLFRFTNEPLVLIHDVNRPFASGALITRVLKTAAEQGAAASMVYPPIPVARTADGRVEHSLARNEVMLPQCPQAFQRAVLERAIQNGRRQGRERQTTWQLVEMNGERIAVVEGEETNIKITTAMDWDVARLVVWPRIMNGDRI